MEEKNLFAHFIRAIILCYCYKLARPKQYKGGGGALPQVRATNFDEEILALIIVIGS